MAGNKLTRMRQMVTEAACKMADVTGTADEPFARNRLDALKAELAKEEEHHAKFGKKPGAPSAWNPVDAPRVQIKKASDAKRRSAARLVGGKALGDMRTEDLGVKAGALAAEIAVAGVPKNFAAVRPGAPEPLTDAEFTDARDIVATVSAGEGDGAHLLSDGSMTRDRWLAEAFPSLTADRRVKCARFLHAMATAAADKPDDDAPNGATVIENALKAAGMSYIEFANACQTDVRFSDAQEAVKSARKRCLMDRLEETLQNRALFGQMEETCDRFGQRNEIRRIDNRLAFDMLKNGHDKYLKQNIQDKAVAGAMTMMIAQSNFPPPSSREPKQAEVIDVQ